MAKELQPVVLRLKTWRAQNDISQTEAAELLRRRGLPIRLRTLQAWEAGRSAPNPFAAVAITEFLDKHPTVSVKRDPSRPGSKESMTNPEVKVKVLGTMGEMAIGPDAIARAIAFAIEQPADVDVNEIIVRPTAQG